MVTKYYKISFKSLENNSFKIFLLYRYIDIFMYMYLFPVFILVNEINRQITTSEIYLLKGDTSLSGEMEIVFTELLLF